MFVAMSIVYSLLIAFIANSFILMRILFLVVRVLICIL